MESNSDKLSRLESSQSEITEMIKDTEGKLKRLGDVMTYLNKEIASVAEQASKEPKFAEFLTDIDRPYYIMNGNIDFDKYSVPENQFRDHFSTRETGRGIIDLIELLEYRNDIRKKEVSAFGSPDENYFYSVLLSASGVWGVIALPRTGGAKTEFSFETKKGAEYFLKHNIETLKRYKAIM